MEEKGVTQPNKRSRGESRSNRAQDREREVGASAFMKKAIKQFIGEGMARLGATRT